MSVLVRIRDRLFPAPCVMPPPSPAPPVPALIDNPYRYRPLAHRVGLTRLSRSDSPSPGGKGLGVRSASHRPTSHRGAPQQHKKRKETEIAPPAALPSHHPASPQFK